MKKRDWKLWFRCAGMRAVRTIAQTAIATIGTSAMLGQANWMAVFSTAAMAGVLSLLTSVASLPEYKEE